VSATAQAVQTTDVATEIIGASIDQITPSKSNPRKSFKGIDELAASVRVHGVISPLLVRPADSRVGTAYELVAGERRWRAAKKAGLKHVPAIVRELSDKEVLEIQVIENVQRADVHPIEEADGYEVLLEKHGYDVEGIAAKIGKSKAYVYARLKLAALAPYPRKAFLEDRLNASIALLIARIPDVGLQEKATREILAEPAALQADEFAGAVDNDNDPVSYIRRELRTDEVVDKAEPVPMSVREAQVHLRRRYMLRLELATFTLADAQLVPKAGACTDCSFRTGNQRELFSEVAAADVCTNPPCFEEKTRAAFDQKAAAAKAQGVKVVEKEKTERMFSPIDGRTVAGSSPYVDPKSEVPRDLVGWGTSKLPTWEQLLGKKIEAPKALVQDQTGAARELLDKNATVKALRDAGKLEKAGKSGGSTATSAKEREAAAKKREAEEAKLEIKQDALKRSLAGVAAAMNKIDEKKELAVWRWIAKRCLIDDEGLDLVLERRGIKSMSGIETFVDKSKSVNEIWSLLVEVLFAQVGHSVNGYWSSGNDKEAFEQGLKLFGVKWDQLQEVAKEHRKVVAELAEAKKPDVDANPKKKGGKKS
jgi:ParB/RepB/Spo0J family partition protein